MKADIHPDTYRQVIFEDMASGARFLIGSTVHTTETGTWEDGKEYPKLVVEISSQSHPFYTGTQKSVDNMGGRVERFRNRFGKTAAK